MDELVPLITLSGHSSVVTSVAFNSDGLLASGSWDKSVKVWKDGSLISTLRGHDGRAPCICEMYRCSEVAKNYNPACPLSGHSNTVSSVAFNSDGLLASGSWDKSVKVWKDGSLVRTLRGHKGAVNCVAWSLSGVLASGSTDTSIILWQHDKLLCTLSGHSSAVRAVAFSSDGLLASGSYDHSIKLWKDGDCISTLRGHDGKDGCLCEVDKNGNVTVNPSCHLRGHEGRVGCVAWGTGEVLASGGWDDNSIIIWDINAGVAKCFLRGHDRKEPCICGKYPGGHTEYKPVCPLSGHSVCVSSVAFSSNGLLASGSGDNTIKLWRGDSDMYKCISTLTGHKRVMDVAFGPTWFAIVLQQEISISQRRKEKYESRFAKLPENCLSRILFLLGSALASTSGLDARIGHV